MNTWADVMDFMTTVHCVEKVHGLQDFSTQFYDIMQIIFETICIELGKEHSMSGIKTITPDTVLPSQTQILFGGLKLWMNSESIFPYLLKKGVL